MKGKEDLKRLAVESFQVFFSHTGLIIESKNKNAARPKLAAFFL